MQAGIIGLPNSGKSTLFNALTKSNVLTAGYPFTTIEPNLGHITLEDEHLDLLTDLFKAAKKTAATIEFVDIAGLVKNAHQGEGLGNLFLDHIRKVDALIHVIRAFADENIAHVQGKINPLQDLQTVENELRAADIKTLNRRIAKVEPQLKTGLQKYKDEMALLEKIKSCLSEGIPARSLQLAVKENDYLEELFLLTAKPVLYVINGNDPDDAVEFKLQIKDMTFDSEILYMDAQLEAEISEMAAEDAQDFLDELNQETILTRFVRAVFKLLKLIKYYTGNKNEVRAWNIAEGSTLIQVAEKVHTDIAKGFIKGEVIHSATLINEGSWSQAKEKGLLRAEGKNYQIKQDEVVYIHFRS